MQVRFLRTMQGVYGRARRGESMDIPDTVAERLVKLGRAVPVAAQTPEVASRIADPSTDGRRRTGGRTGMAKRSSSSQEVRARASTTSKPSGDAPASS